MIKARTILVKQQSLFIEQLLWEEAVQDKQSSFFNEKMAKRKEGQRKQ